ncbi:MAG TPA: hypothetical protein VFG45_09850 [Candidatus Nitrosocosmicus sp.]|nr:hypothetical protein [Candidatus Nitrosocosmicus sp.]
MSTIFVIATALICSLFLPSSSVYAKSPYDSGYDHGCDDANISNPSDRYINQPEKGPSFHTSEFMNGYDAGFNSCGESNNYQPEPYQPNSRDYSTSNGYSTNREDKITSFCSDLQRGDYRAAEGVLSLLGGGSLVAGAEALCAGWNLGAFLDSQGAIN